MPGHLILRGVALLFYPASIAVWWVAPDRYWGMGLAWVGLAGMVAGHVWASRDPDPVVICYGCRRATWYPSVRVAEDAGWMAVKPASVGWQKAEDCTHVGLCPECEAEAVDCLSWLLTVEEDQWRDE